MNEEYEINPLTYANVKLRMEASFFGGAAKELYSPLKPLEIIKMSCRLLDWI